MHFSLSLTESWWKKASLATLILGGLLGAYQFYFTYWPFWVFQMEIENARITDLMVNEPVMPRKEVVKMLHNDIVDPVHKRYALVVSGPRGTGKSCAVKMAMEGYAGTVVVPFVSSMEADLWRAIGVKRLPPDTQVDILMRHYLKKLPKPPIFILEVDSQCTAKDVQDLLLQVKRWGFKERLARFVVVVSGSRILREVQIGLSELRCDYVEVGDLSKKEAEEFARHIFSRLSDGEVVNRLVERVVDNCGGRLLFLHELQEYINRAEGKGQSVEKAVDTYIRGEIKLCENYIKWTVLEVNNNKACKSFLEKLLEGQPLCYSEIIGDSEEMLSPKEILQFQIAHVIYVHPRSLLITTGSRFMEKAMEQYLKKMAFP